MSHKRMAGTFLVSVAAVFAFGAAAQGWEGQRKWGGRSGSRFAVTGLAKIRANPSVYLGKKVTFEAFYAGRGSLYRPYFTRFIKQDFINIQVWDVSSKLWIQKERRDGFLFLYVAREYQREVDFLEQLPRFRAVKIYGEIRQVHEGMPWIEIHHIELSSRRSYTEKGLKHIELAFSRLSVGDYELAARSFEIALREGLPFSAEAAINRELGIAYYKLGEYAKAKRALSYGTSGEAVKADVELTLRLGQTLLKLGEYKDSAGQLERVIDLEPSLAEAHASLGLAYGHLKRYELGLRSCRDALKLASHYAAAERNIGKIYWMMGDLEKAVKSLEEAILSDASEPLYHRELGDISMQMKNYEKAQEEYNNVIKLKLDDPEAHVLKARALEAQGKSKEATGHYEQAMSAGPNYLPGFRGAVKVYVDAGEYEKAKDALQRVKELAPEDAEAIGLLADVYRRLRQLDKCVKTYQEAVELDPNYVDGWVNLMLLLPNMPENPDLDKGIEAGETALRIDPNNAKALYYLGRYYHKKGDLPMAARKLDACLKVEPDNHGARELAGVIDMTQGSNRRAEAAFRKVVEAAPQRLYAKNNLAFLLASPKDPSEEALREALDLARAAHKGSPDNPDFKDTLAYVLFRLDEFAEGRPLVAQAVAAEETPLRLYHLALFDIKIMADVRAKSNLMKAKSMLKRTKGDQLSEKLRRSIDDALNMLKRRRRRAPVVEEFGGEAAPGVGE